MSYIELLKEFHALGCSDKIQCAIACQVFNTLQQDQNVSELTKVYNPDLHAIYLQCKRGKETCYYYPAVACRSLELSAVEQFQNFIKTHDPDGSFYVAVCDTSSNVLFYKFQFGFHEKLATNTMSSNSTTNS